MPEFVYEGMMIGSDYTCGAAMKVGAAVPEDDLYSFEFKNVRLTVKVELLEDES